MYFILRISKYIKLMFSAERTTNLNQIKYFVYLVIQGLRLYLNFQMKIFRQYTSN